MIDCQRIDRQLDVGGHMRACWHADASRGSVGFEACDHVIDMRREQDGE